MTLGETRTAMLARADERERLAAEVWHRGGGATDHVRPVMFEAYNRWRADADAIRAEWAAWPGEQL